MKVAKLVIPIERVYWLSEKSKHLLGGADYKSAISDSNDLLGGSTAPSTIEVSGGSTVLPAQPRQEGREDIIVGLTQVTGETKKKHFFVVDSQGNPLNQGAYDYAAANHCAAAVKAFYAWWRTSKQGDKCVSESIVSMRMSAVPQQLIDYIQNFGSKVTAEQKKEYIKKFLCIDKEKISREIIIRVGEAGTKKVKFYRVSYKPNLKPNALEIQNKMVVMASAIWVPGDTIFPPNAVEFETLIS
jgi:hypothetical protein